MYFKPMLLSESLPFDDPDFIYELKFDGFRAIAYLQRDSTTLISRNGKDLTGKFPVLNDLHSCAESPCILDGEIIAPHFPPTSLPGAAQFIVFDILTDKPLIERKQVLSDVISESPRLVISRFVHTHGKDLFDLACAQNLEGIVAKRKNSRYYHGKRSTDWIKIRNPAYARHKLR